MAGEAAATPAVRRPAAAQGLAAALGAVPGRPGGLRNSGEVVAEARKSKPMAPAAALRPGILEDGNVIADDSE